MPAGIRFILTRIYIVLFIHSLSAYYHELDHRSFWLSAYNLHGAVWIPGKPLQGPLFHNGLFFSPVSLLLTVTKYPFIQPTFMKYRMPGTHLACRAKHVHCGGAGWMINT